MDPRIKKLADLLIDYSCDVQPGEKVLIDYEGECSKNLARQLIKNVYAKGGLPYAQIRDAGRGIDVLHFRKVMVDHFQNRGQLVVGHAERVGRQQLDGFRVRCNGCQFLQIELSDVPSEKLNLYSRLTQPTLDYRVNETKWVVLRYPNYSMAQLAGSSLEKFEDFYFDVCTLDYKKMSKAMDPLVDLMNRTDKVRIEGPGTDLTFSIKGIGAVKCDGLRNIPDGEVYTAPVRESMNGVISYNTPSEEQGFTYENIVFEVKDGKIVKATSNDDKKINELLDADEGARYFGEFALGVNPYILHPMKDTLFDEKISGSFHLTPGMCYEDAPNGNTSANHWDLVMIQRPEYGGGRIWFDDVLIREDGIFVLPELAGLNPENLK